MACNFMIYVSFHWRENGINDTSLFYFGIKHAVCIHNRVPNLATALKPIELLTKTKTDYKYPTNFHICGYPVFVLYTKTKQGKKNT